MIRALAIACAGLPLCSTGAAHALDLNLPGNARLIYEQVTGPDSYALPVGAFANGHQPVQIVKGNVSRQVFRTDSQGSTTLQLLEPLLGQVTSGGFETILECSTDQCGGFDFRFQTEIIPAPDMHVDLTDFRFLSAHRDKDGVSEYLSLLVSGSDLAGYVQLIRVSPSPIESVRITKPVEAQRALVDDGGVVSTEALEQKGYSILSDLTFKTGSATLGDGPFLSLQVLANFLIANTGRRVALVGHTDAQGSLENNIALSKRRAKSVLERLVSEYGVDRAQMAAEGMGYLSPIASNLTPEGREANRRVEAVLLNTE